MSDTATAGAGAEAERLSIVGFARAQRAGLPVGRCSCGGALSADGPPSTDLHGVVWLESTCGSCNTSYASPNGHTLEDAERRARERWRAGQHGYVADGPGRTVGQPTGEFTR